MFAHNIQYSNNSVYNNKQFCISHAKNLGNTHYFTRLRREVIPYTNNSVIYHPTKPGLMKGTLNLNWTRGTTTSKFYWTANDSPANCTPAVAISNYKQFLNEQANSFSNSTVVTVTDETANSITIQINFGHDDESYRDANDMYVPDSAKSKTTFANNVTCVCWMNINNTHQHYKIKETDLKENVQRTFEKFDNECYVVFSANVVTDGGTTLNEFQMYKLNSDTITGTPSANGKAIYYYGQPD